MKPNLDRVILSLPSLLVSLATTTDTDGAPRRSYIQLAKTGTFHSSRYGKFSITKDDLAQMLHNFRHVTPAAPTELPIDYDHLSMDPKKPGDGIAAGWLKRVELRAEGEELWGEVSWTDEAAKLIKKRAYRFVSPSFVKDHTHKDGRKIGTTLLAAAITNHPFLEGMQALTLYSFSAMGDLALAAQAPGETAVHLTEVGQVLTFIENEEATPELSPEERAQTFIVTAVRGQGDDAFVKLETAEGRKPYGWYPLNVLAPAPARERTTPEDTTMQDTKTTEQRAAAFEQRMTALSQGRTARQAFDLAQNEDKAGAEAYRLRGVGIQQAEAAPAPTSINLSVREGETFDDAVERYQHEHGVSAAIAAHAVAVAYPELAAARD